MESFWPDFDNPSTYSTRGLCYAYFALDGWYIMRTSPFLFFLVSKTGLKKKGP
jgi:hypothetical protein